MSSVTIISSNNMLSIFIPFVANKILLDETKKLFLVTNFEQGNPNQTAAVGYCSLILPLLLYVLVNIIFGRQISKAL